MILKTPKVCIVTVRNIFDAPCLLKYRELINQPFDIIYWDRCNITEECGAVNYYRFDGALAPESSKAEKLKMYISFTQFAKNILKKSDYEKIIVFPTHAAWLILPLLKKKYKGKYLLDIRDYAGEKNFLISKLTGSAVKYAGLVSITSPAYREFLPERDYLISHNIQPIDSETVAAYRGRVRNKEDKIVLSFIGSVRFIDMQIKVIEAFGNDERFELKFIGRGSEQLQKFCADKKVKNVELIGQFKPEQLSEFYIKTDMALNVYGNQNPYLDYALSNKLYSAAIMGMPILVSPDTYMETVAEQYGFGLAVDPRDKGCADSVYEYYVNCKPEEIQVGCDRFLNDVMEDERLFSESVKFFLAEG
ncbi:MAG: hypothetical protein ACI4FN_05725 [Acutalibacteraceae bacterium]